MREVTSLIAAYTSEINVRQLYLANEERWRVETQQIEQQIRHLEKHHARLRAYRENGESGLHACHDRVAALRRELVELRNKDDIERAIRLQRELNEHPLAGARLSDILEKCAGNGDPTMSEKHSTL